MNHHLRLRASRLLLLVVIVTIAMGACDAEAPPSGPVDGHPASLASSSWVVASIDGIVPNRGNQPSIEFGQASVKGSGGCNSFGGNYAYDPASGEIRFDQLGMTAMACAEPERNAVETRFIQALGTGVVATLQPNGQLVLASPVGTIVLTAAGQTIVD